MNWVSKKLIHKFINIILPRACAGCGKENEAFCEACRLASYKSGAQCLICGFRNNDGKICQKCLTWKLGFHLETKFPLKRVLWAGRYNGALKEAVWQFKYKKRKELAAPLAEMLWKKFKENHLSAQPQVDYVIIPIPLHFKKGHDRGFNQAELLAQEFSRLSRIPLLTNLLLKVEETPAQVEVKNKEERIKNLDSAFSADAKKLTAYSVKHKAIILIDDVSTTGATLIHAAHALAKAGAVNIIGFVVAHG